MWCVYMSIYLIYTCGYVYFGSGCKRVIIEWSLFPLFIACSERSLDLSSVFICSLLKLCGWKELTSLT